MRDLTLAWQVVRVYVRTQNKKALPALTELIREIRGEGATKRVPEQSLAQQRIAVEALAAAYGLKLGPRKPRKVLQPHEAQAVRIKPVIKKRVVRKVRHR